MSNLTATPTKDATPEDITVRVARHIQRSIDLTTEIADALSMLNCPTGAQANDQQHRSRAAKHLSSCWCIAQGGSLNNERTGNQCTKAVRSIYYEKKQTNLKNALKQEKERSTLVHHATLSHFGLSNSNLIAHSRHASGNACDRCAFR